MQTKILSKLGIMSHKKKNEKLKNQFIRLFESDMF